MILCPLYLFVIISQGLSAIFNNLATQKKIQGICIARGSPRITHLFFADDSLIFFKANRDNCSNIKKGLQDYEIASGQQVNFDKSTIAFSKCTPRDNILFIKTCLNLSVCQGHDLYLDLPTFSLRTKWIQFGYLRDRVAKKLDNWKARFFSDGGLEILIKAVIQAIPTYAMSCFRIPSSINHEIEALCANFWWGYSANGKKLHWKAWSKLKDNKEDGGLAFRDLSLFNKALLAKKIWRIIENPSSLLARFLKARYFKHMDIMEAPLGSNPSYIWRSLIWSRDIISNSLYWKVGDGE